MCLKGEQDGICEKKHSSVAVSLQMGNKRSYCSRLTVTLGQQWVTLTRKLHYSSLYNCVNGKAFLQAFLGNESDVKLYGITEPHMVEPSAQGVSINTHPRA